MSWGCAELARPWGAAAAAPILHPGGHSADTPAVEVCPPDGGPGTGDSRGHTEGGHQVGVGEIHTFDEAPVVREMQALVGPLTGDEAALVRALTPRDLSNTELVQHMFQLVDLLTTVRTDEEMADYVYAIAPQWDDSIELLVLAGMLVGAVERHELARAA